MTSQPNALRAGAIAFAAAAAWACSPGAPHPAPGAVPPPVADVAAVADVPAGAGHEPAAASGQADATSPDQVLVQVNGAPLTRGDVDARIDAVVGPQLGRVPAELRGQLREQLTGRVLDEMVVQTLLAQAAEQGRVAVADEEVDSAVREISAGLPPGRTLAESLEALGMDEAELEREVARELRIEKLLEREVASPAAPSDVEVTRYYTENLERFQRPERVRVRHILIATTPGDDDAARAAKREKAQQIRDQLAAANGEGFAAVAAEKSDCPSKERGGDLGEFSRGEMVPAFETAAFAQKPGEIGPVVETDFGYHVVLVDEHHPADTVPLAEVKAAIAEELSAEKRRAAVEKYVEALRAKATIVYPSAEAA